MAKVFQYYTTEKFILENGKIHSVKQISENSPVFFVLNFLHAWNTLRKIFEVARSVDGELRSGHRSFGALTLTTSRIHSSPVM